MDFPYTAAKASRTNVYEKGPVKSPASAKPRRDPDAIGLAMLQAASAGQAASTALKKAGRPTLQDPVAIGLTLRDLEDRRWCVSSAIAKAKLLHAGLPYEGRRAGLIYSWASIFRAEGIPEEIAKNTTREDYPDLYSDLLDTSGAAELLGYRDPSSIRKLAGSGNIPETAYIKFGTRGVYRFRRGPLMALRKSVSAGRIV